MVEKFDLFFKQFSRNSFFSAISEFSNIFLFILLIFAARYLGDVNFGVFCFALAFVGIIEIINDFGLRFVYTREVSRDKSLAGNYLGNMLTIQIFLSLIGLTLVVLITNYLSVSWETRLVVYLMEGAGILRVLKFLLRFVFRTFDRFDLETISLLIERIVLLAVGMLVLILGYSIVVFAAVFLVVRVFDFMIAFVFLKRKVIRPHLRFDFSLWPRLLMPAVPFAIAYFSSMALMKTDTVMLSIMRDDAEVGWYRAARHLVEGVSIFSMIFRNSLFPAMSAMHMKSRQIVNDLYIRGVKYMFLISVPAAVLGTLVADKVIFIFYGEQYMNSVIVFEILLWSLPFYFVTRMQLTLLGAINKQHISVYFTLIILLINIVLNSILIPLYGYIGAAIATLISEIIFSITTSSYLLYHKYKASMQKILWKPLLATLPLAVILIKLRNTHLVLLIVIFSIAYFVIVTLFKFWDEEEIVLFKKICRSAKERVLG